MWFLFKSKSCFSLRAYTISLGIDGKLSLINQSGDIIHPPLATLNFINYVFTMIAEKTNRLECGEKNHNSVAKKEDATYSL